MAGQLRVAHASMSSDRTCSLASKIIFNQPPCSVFSSHARRIPESHGNVRTMKTSLAVLGAKLGEQKADLGGAAKTPEMRALLEAAD